MAEESNLEEWEKDLLAMMGPGVDDYDDGTAEVNEDGTIRYEWE